MVIKYSINSSLTSITPQTERRTSNMEELSVKTRTEEPAMEIIIEMYDLENYVGCDDYKS